MPAGPNERERASPRRDQGERPTILNSTAKHAKYTNKRPQAVRCRYLFASICGFKAVRPAKTLSSSMGGERQLFGDGWKESLSGRHEFRHNNRMDGRS
jgi:hypothetical protein